MREDFLQYVWQSKLIASKNIFSTDNEPVIIKNQGRHNFNSGPDFLNAKIKIGKQLWAGNVEIHVKSSDWYVHHHETDTNYDSVILHVVWENDAQIFRKDNSVIPTLVLKEYISSSVLHNFKQLFLRPQGWINCEKHISNTNKFLRDNWLERLFIERLEQKSVLILELLKASNNDWEAVLFTLLAKNFGLKVNGEAFLNLAKSIDFSIVRKIRHDQKDFEALLFGQAKILDDDIDDNYFLELKSIYEYQKIKFRLQSNHNKQIQFFRLRPNNFPTIRLAQLAALYHKHQNLFSKIIEINNADEMYELFAITTTSFWQTHYTFTSVSTVKRNRNLSKSFIDLVIINTIIPLQFIYQKYIGKLEAEKSIHFMSQIKPESNSIIDRFKSLKISSNNAYKTQALLQLKNEYCVKNRCLQCEIGNALLLGKKEI